MSTQAYCFSAAGVLPPREDLWLYHDRTVALLRRYFQMALEIGRLPSLFGREFFRARVTSYRRSSFEDAVIFVHDIERCIEDLDQFSQLLIARIVFQNYSQEEAAVLLGCPRTTLRRQFSQAIDELTEIFLDRAILVSLPNTERVNR